MTYKVGDRVICLLPMTEEEQSRARAVRSNNPWSVTDLDGYPRLSRQAFHEGTVEAVTDLSITFRPDGQESRSLTRLEAYGVLTPIARKEALQQEFKDMETAVVTATGEV